MTETKLDGSSYTQGLADFVATTKFEDLPPEVVEYTKRIILDTLGCMIGGYALEREKSIVEVANELGGKPQATILVTGDRVSWPTAAFVNADMANALDADDTFLNFSHFANVVVSDSLAAAERQGSTGKDLILAVALGFDVAARVGLSLSFIEAVDGDIGVKVREVNGLSWATLGAAAAAGKLLGLDQTSMSDAIGIAGAVCPSPSSRKVASSPRWSSLKYAPYMIMAHTGALAALLASRGYSGERTILDGDSGFWRFQGAAECAWEFLSNDLGKKWWILETSFKPFPSCRYTHPVLELFYRVMKERQLRPEEIESVTARVNPVFYKFPTASLAALELDPNDATTPLNLQFNLPYLISVAALGARPGPDWFTPDKLLDPKVRAFMAKVKLELDTQSVAELLKALRNEPTKRFKKCPGSIKVIARGQTFDVRTDYALGDPHTPETRMTDDGLKDKFREYARQLLPQRKVEKAIKMAYELEKLDNVTTLVKSCVR